MHWVTGLNPGTPFCRCSLWAASILGELFTFCSRGKGNPQQQDSLMPSIDVISWAKIVWCGVTKIWRDGTGWEERRKNLSMNREERKWCYCLRKCPCPVFYNSMSVTQLAKVLLMGTRANKTWLLEHTEKVNRNDKLPGSPKQLRWRFKQIVKINMSDFVVDLFCVVLVLVSPPTPPGFGHLYQKNPVAKLRPWTNQYPKREGRVVWTRRAAKPRWASWEQRSQSLPWPCREARAAFLRGQQALSVCILLSPALQKVHLLSVNPPGSTSLVLYITKSRCKEKRSSTGCLLVHLLSSAFMCLLQGTGSFRFLSNSLKIIIKKVSLRA